MVPNNFFLKSSEFFCSEKIFENPSPFHAPTRMRTPIFVSYFLNFVSFFCHSVKLKKIKRFSALTGILHSFHTASSKKN